MNVKNAPRPMLTTPIKVMIILTEPGAIGDNAMTTPIVPVAKNIIMRTLARTGSMYLIKIREMYFVINSWSEFHRFEQKQSRITL